MRLLQVRDVPEHIYRLLAERAGRERRSLAQEAVITLARGLQVEADAKGRRAKLLEAIESRPGSGRLSDPARLIREDRLR